MKAAATVLAYFVGLAVVAGAFKLSGVAPEDIAGATVVIGIVGLVPVVAVLAP